MVIDPQLQRVLDILKQAGRPSYDVLTPIEARALYRQSCAVFQPPPPEVAECRDMSVPGPRGAIPIRLYRGRNTASDRPLPALIYFHGGGWTIGDLETHDYVCRTLANKANCLVAAVDYRLAPEHKFPAGVEDCTAATRVLAERATEFGIDANRIAVGGDSAGGNLATVMAHLARDGALPPPCFQLLIYPAVDQSLQQASYERVTEGFVLTTTAVRWFQGQYFADERDKADWRASPLRAPEFRGLAPAFVLTVEHDPLCDEGQDYARVLEANGVRVSRLHVNDQMHGCFTMSGAMRAAAAMLDICAVMLRCAFGPDGAPQQT
jgi:acetyl esterase